MNLINSFNIEKEPPDFENFNGLFLSKDKNPWLFKILLTNFPVSINDKIRGLNYEEIDSALSKEELIKFIDFLNSNLFNQNSLNPKDYETGSLIFLELGAGKSKSLEYDYNLKGIKYSLSILNRISKNHTNDLQKIYIKNIENLVSAAKVEFLEFKLTKEEFSKLEVTENDKDIPDIIEFLVGFPSIITDLEIKNNPNFYVYFPISDELHEYNLFVHCNFFHNLSQRTSLDRGKRNEILLKYLTEELINRLNDLLNVNKDLYKKLFCALLLSNWRSQHRNEWIHKIFIMPLIDFIKEKIPTINNKFENKNKVRIKGTKLKISPPDFGVQSYNWLFSENENIIKNAKDSSKLNIKEADLFDLIADSSDTSMINHWFENNQDCIESFFDELDSQLKIRLIDNNTSFNEFLKNFSELKLFRFSDGCYYSLNNVLNNNNLMFVNEQFDIYDLLKEINIVIFVIRSKYNNINSLLAQKFEYLENESKFYDFFCSRVASLELKVLRKSAIDILKYFNKFNHAVFNKLIFYPHETDYFVIKQKNDSLQHYYLSEDKPLLRNYIQKNFSSALINLENDLYQEINNTEGVLEDKILYEHLLNTETDLLKLVDVISEADNSSIQRKYLSKLFTLELNENQQYYPDTSEHKIVSMALKLKFEELKEKIKIKSSSGSKFELKNINYSEKVNFKLQDKSYELSLSKILPDLSDTIGLADKIIRQFVDIDYNTLAKFFDLAKSKPKDKIFSELQDDLINSHQLAFVFLYYLSETKKPDITKFYIRDIKQNKRRLEPSIYYIKNVSFISTANILSEIYKEIADILELNNEQNHLGDQKFIIALEPFFEGNCFICSPLVSDFKENQKAKNDFLDLLAQKFNNRKETFRKITFDTSNIQTQLNIPTFKDLFGFDPELIILNEEYALPESEEILPDWIMKKYKDDSDKFNVKLFTALGMNDDDSNIVKLRKALKGLIEINNELLIELRNCKRGYLIRTLIWLCKKEEFIPLQSNRYNYLKNLFSIIINNNIEYLPTLSMSSNNEIGVKVRKIVSNTPIYIITLENLKEFLKFGNDTIERIINFMNIPIILLEEVEDTPFKQSYDRYKIIPNYKLDTKNSQELTSNYYKIWKEEYEINIKIYKVNLTEKLNYKLFANDHYLEKNTQKDKEIDIDDHGNLYFTGDENNLENLIRTIYNSEQFISKKFNLLFEIKKNEPQELRKLYEKNLTNYLIIISIAYRLMKQIFHQENLNHLKKNY